MALMLKRMYLGYYWLFDDFADPRMDHVLLSPILVSVILGNYLLFVLNWGPKLMEKRKPFELKKILITYNVLQIIFNGCIIFKGIHIVSNMDWNCATTDRTQPLEDNLELRTCIWFFLLKLFDLFDTVFFVLRKSSRQINFLHVYHHCGMVFGTFIILKFICGGEIIWTGLINAVVHVVMFSYYLLSVIDQKWKNNLTFKKFLTQLQLTQFVLNILIYGRLLFKPDCDFPKLVPLLYIPQNVFMLILFGDFYLRAYVFKKKANKS